jgi:sulfotransferase
MESKIHFISGLPRSGSTLLSAILRQNPRFYGGIQSSVFEIFSSALRTMSSSESSLFISDAQRRRILRAIVSEYHADLAQDHVIFDTNRGWCTVLGAVSELFPDSRVICCVRNPAWILDSVERLVQQNAFITSKMFSHELGTVFNRVETMTKNNFLGPSLNSLRQAWFSERADRLIAVRYDSLVERPTEVIDQLYEILGIEKFAHDFEHLAYDEEEFDARIGMPGLHRVGARIEAKKRETILPPELFSQHDREFWDMPGQNPRRVKIL